MLTLPSALLFDEASHVRKPSSQSFAQPVYALLQAPLIRCVFVLLLITRQTNSGT